MNACLPQLAFTIRRQCKFILIKASNKKKCSILFHYQTWIYQCNTSILWTLSISIWQEGVV